MEPIGATTGVVINFHVWFNGGVTGLDASDIILGGTAGATTAVVTGSGSSYNIAVSGMSQEGTVSISLRPGAVIDGYGRLSSPSPSSDTVYWFYNSPRFDFDASLNPHTQSGMISVEPGGPSGVTSIYNATRASGWLTAPKEFDRGGPNSLLADGNTGTNNTFRVDLPNGDYAVTLIMGDNAYAHTASIINPLTNTPYTDADTGLALSNISTSAGQFVQKTFIAHVVNGNLQVRLTGNFAINAMYVAPVQGGVLPPRPALTIQGLAGVQAADGTNSSLFLGTGAAANALVTISASYSSTTVLGVRTNPLTVLGTDASQYFVGFQVQADSSGNFSFAVKKPTGAGQATITAEQTDGLRAGILGTTPAGTNIASSGSAQQFVLLDPRRFDFNNTQSPVTATDPFDPDPSHPGAGSVTFGIQPSETFTATRGYGWTAAVTSFDRSTSDALNRDGHQGTTTAGVFQIQITAGKNYVVQVYVGDAAYALTSEKVTLSFQGTATPPGTYQNGTVAILGSATPPVSFAGVTTTVSTATKQFKVLTFYVTGAATRDILNVTFTSMAATKRWAVTAIALEDPPSYSPGGAKGFDELAALRSQASPALPGIASTGFFDAPVFQGKVLALAQQAVSAELGPTARVLSNLRFLAKPQHEAASDIMNDDTAESLLSLWVDEA